MNKIYEGQTKWTLTLDTGVDLSDASSIAIQYKKPNGDSGEWKASVANTTQGLVFYNQWKENDLISGTWKVWVKIIDKYRKVSYGQPATFKVYKPGT